MLVTRFQDGLRKTGRVSDRDASRCLEEAFSNPSIFAIHLRDADLDIGRLIPALSALGELTASRRNPDLLRRIRPTPSCKAPPNTLSSRHGLDAFPFHTDGAHWWKPPRYLALYCEDAGETARATVLLRPCVRARTTCEATLRRDPWIVKTGRRAFLAPLVTLDARQRRIRYDAACMTPTTTRSSIAVTTMLEGPTETVSWRRGDLLVIDNHQCLHARAGAERRGRERTLVRVLVGGEPG